MYNLSHIKCQEKNYLIDTLRGKSKKQIKKKQYLSKKYWRNITVREEQKEIK